MQLQSAEQRIQEIKNAVDEPIRRIERWRGDPQAGPALPEDVGIAIQQAEMICRGGDIPQNCLTLATIAVPRLAEEYRKYAANEDGAINRDGAPQPRFIAAAKAVAIARHGIERPKIERIEPMYMLLEIQKVSPMQVAGAIYGRRGVGPFMTDNGTPDDAKMAQQCAAEKFHLLGQGNKVEYVVGPDWIPPWHEYAKQQLADKLKGQLESLDEIEHALHRRAPEDPGTIESMLLDKCYIQIIERYKNVSRAQVLEVAKRLGISPQDQPGYQPESVEPDEDDGKDETYDDSVERDPPEPVKDSASVTPEERLAIVEAWERSEGSMGSPEIRDQLATVGHSLTCKQISASINNHKTKAKRAAASKQPASAE